MSGLILVLNSGSSSLKFSVVDHSADRAVFEGLAEQLGSPRQCHQLEHPSFRATDWHTGKCIFEGLFKSEKFDDSQIHRWMKTQSALIRP